MQPIPDDPAGAASWAHSLMLAIGLGPHLASLIASTVGVLVFLKAALPELLPWLPVPDADSPRWYAKPYGALARLTGNWRNNAPIPVSGDFAGGIVPTPPFLKPKP
jgi:hypothetical protein